MSSNRGSGHASERVDRLPHDVVLVLHHLDVGAEALGDADEILEQCDGVDSAVLDVPLHDPPVGGPR